jgi:hypothetical protein
MNLDDWCARCGACLKYEEKHELWRRVAKQTHSSPAEYTAIIVCEECNHALTQPDPEPDPDRERD